MLECGRLDEDLDMYWTVCGCGLAFVSSRIATGLSGRCLHASMFKRNTWRIVTVCAKSSTQFPRILGISQLKLKLNPTPHGYSQLFCHGPALIQAFTRVQTNSRSNDPDSEPPFVRLFVLSCSFAWVCLCKVQSLKVTGIGLGVNRKDTLQ